MPLRPSRILRGEPCSNGSGAGRSPSSSWHAGSTSRAPRCPSISAFSRMPVLFATGERARATTTASTQTRSPSCASTSRASGRTHSRPSRKPPRKESPMMQETSEAAITKSVIVRQTAEEAFELFTTGIARWWPVKTHSVAQDNADTVVLEPREGGRFYERTRDGDEHLWGTVTAWEPPRRLACTWHPGRDEETGQEIELLFEAHDEGT